jgi:DNA-binding NarL/FixJ family response regulator
MPGINGFECLEELKKNKDQFANIPVLIYSTSANPEQVKQVYDKGANLYLQKPTSFEGIKTLMKKVLNLNFSEYFPKAMERHIVFRA